MFRNFNGFPVIVARDSSKLLDKSFNSFQVICRLDIDLRYSNHNISICSSR